jgi:F-type H+-transporting ATPase subunit a
MRVILAATPPGTHQLTSICGDGYWNLQVIKFYYCSFSADTLISSGLAIAVTLGLSFYIASRLNPLVPGKLQMVLELLLSYARGLVREQVAEGGDFIFPLAATIGIYILIANWLAFFPLHAPIIPANSDLNQTLAMAIVVFILVEGYAIKVRGFTGYLRYFMRPPFPPLTIIEEITKPITLALRLFGNIFAGLLMVYLLTLLPEAIPWTFPISALLVILWKAFDVFFVGSIQAFIFMLLTIIYFGLVREGLDEEHHAAPATTSSSSTGEASLASTRRTSA